MKIEEIKNKIINGNCLEIMRELPNECIDLAVTSPPYNLKNSSVSSPATGKGIW
jgi:modification methylase